MGGDTVRRLLGVLPWGRSVSDDVALPPSRSAAPTTSSPQECSDSVEGAPPTPIEPEIANPDNVIELVLQLSDGSLTSITAGAEWTVQELRAMSAIKTETLLRSVRLTFEDEELSDDMELADLGLENESIIRFHCLAGFEVGQRLEARDRRNPGLLCVASILDVREATVPGGNQEVLIHFDGWSSSYDYWTDIATSDIAPVGTCSRLGYLLQKPHRLRFDSWEWYLNEHNYTPSPPEIFRLPEGEEYFPSSSDTAMSYRHYHQSPVDVLSNRVYTSPVATYSSDVPFEVGQAIEARDRKNVRYLCVARIKDVRAEGKEVLVSFDGWSDNYDYWTNVGSPDIAPIGTCRAMNYYLEPPRGLTFESWESYLSRDGRVPTPVAAFQTEIEFFSNGPHKSSLTRRLISF